MLHCMPTVVKCAGITTGILFVYKTHNIALVVCRHHCNHTKATLYDALDRVTADPSPLI